MRRFWGGWLVALVVIAIWAGCRPRVNEPIATLSEPLPIRGFATSENAERLGLASVRLETVDGQLLATGSTNEDGAFFFPTRSRPAKSDKVRVVVEGQTTENKPTTVVRIATFSELDHAIHVTSASTEIADIYKETGDKSAAEDAYITNHKPSKSLDVYRNGAYLPANSTKTPGSSSRAMATATSFRPNTMGIPGLLGDNISSFLVGEAGLQVMNLLGLGSNADSAQLAEISDQLSDIQNQLNSVQSAINALGQQITQVEATLAQDIVLGAQLGQATDAKNSCSSDRLNLTSLITLLTSVFTDLELASTVASKPPPLDFDGVSWGTLGATSQHVSYQNAVNSLRGTGTTAAAVTTGLATIAQKLIQSSVNSLTGGLLNTCQQTLVAQNPWITSHLYDNTLPLFNYYLLIESIALFLENQQTTLNLTTIVEENGVSATCLTDGGAPPTLGECTTSVAKGCYEMYAPSMCPITQANSFYPCTPLWQNLCTYDSAVQNQAIALKPPVPPHSFVDTLQSVMFVPIVKPDAGCSPSYADYQDASVATVEECYAWSITDLFQYNSGALCQSGSCDSCLQAAGPSSPLPLCNAASPSAAGCVSSSLQDAVIAAIGADAGVDIQAAGLMTKAQWSTMFNGMKQYLPPWQTVTGGSALRYGPSYIEVNDAGTVNYVNNFWPSAAISQLQTVYGTAVGVNPLSSSSGNAPSEYALWLADYTGYQCLNTQYYMPAVGDLYVQGYYQDIASLTSGAVLQYCLENPPPAWSGAGYTMATGCINISNIFNTFAGSGFALRPATPTRPQYSENTPIIGVSLPAIATIPIAVGQFSVPFTSP